MNVPDDENIPNVRAECPEDGQGDKEVSGRSQVVRNAQMMICFDELMPPMSIPTKTKVVQFSKPSAVDCEAVSCPELLSSTSPEVVFYPVPEVKASFGDFTRDNTILIDEKYNPTTDDHILIVFEGVISSLKAANASVQQKRDKWRIKGTYTHDYDVCQYEAQLLHVPTSVGLKKEARLAVELKLKGLGGRDSFFNLVQVTAFNLTTDGGGEVAEEFASGAPIIDPKIVFMDVFGADSDLSDDPDLDDFALMPLSFSGGEWQSGIILEGADDELLDLWVQVLNERNYVTLIDTLKSAAKASELYVNATAMSSSNEFLYLIAEEVCIRQKKMDGSLVLPAVSILSNMLRFDSANVLKNLPGQKMLDDVCDVIAHFAKHGSNVKLQEIATKMVFQLVELGFKTNDKAKESLRGIFEGVFQQDNSCEQLFSNQLISTVG